MTPLYLGIDVGGTVVKSAVFDEHGREVAIASQPLRAVHTRPGYSERDTVQMWQATAATIRRVLDHPDVSARQIAAVCATGHGNGVYLLDANGEPVGPGVVSSDTRAHHITMAADARPDLARVRAIRGQQFHVSEPLMLFAWFDANEPMIVKQTQHAVLCKDYVRYRLNGRIESDVTDLSGSGLLDLDAGDYSPAVFEALDLVEWRSKLPPVRRNSELCGSVTQDAARETGLLAGTAVVAGTMDLDAMVLAAGVVDASRFIICAGTWSINLLVLEAACRGHLPLMQALHRDGSRIIACEGSPTSATNLAWMLDTVFDGARPDFATVNAMVAGLAPQDSHLVYLPDIHGSAGAPQASFVGLGHHSDRAHLLRAVYEGVVYAHLDHIDDLAATTGIRPNVARLCGGAAQSPVWAQMFADVLEMDIEIPEGSELGALGCAICAAVGTGRYDGFEPAIAAMTRIGRSYRPDPSKALIYRAKHAAFRRVRRALEPIWPDLGGDLDRAAVLTPHQVQKSNRAEAL